MNEGPIVGCILTDILFVLSLLKVGVAILSHTCHLGRSKSLVLTLVQPALARVNILTLVSDISIVLVILQPVETNWNYLEQRKHPEAT